MERKIALIFLVVICVLTLCLSYVNLNNSENKTPNSESTKHSVSIEENSLNTNSASSKIPVSSSNNQLNSASTSISNSNSSSQSSTDSTVDMLQKSEGLSYRLNADETSYAVSGIGTCTDKVIVIPEKYDELPVTSIKDSAFDDCSAITSITIPNSVTSIGNLAFSGCRELTSISIPNSVESIGNDAFNNSNKLVYNEYENAYYLGNDTNKYLVLVKEKNSSITSYEVNVNTKIIYDYSFYICNELISITIPNNVTSIGGNAFYGCNKLVEIYNLSSLTIEMGSIENGYVGYYAKCINTSKEIPSKLSTDANGYVIYTDGTTKSLIAYVGTETELTLPSDITEINSKAFYCCTKLTSVTIGNNVTLIGDEAFYFCAELTSVTIGNSVTTIGNSAFSYCDELTSIVIPNGVTTIGDDVFYGCSKLTNIEIPTSVTKIGKYNF